MEQQVGGLVEKQLFIVVFCLNDQFYRFLAYFLCNFIDSFAKQLSYIRLVVFTGFTQFDNILQVEQKILAMVAFAPAGIRPGMTGWAQWFCFYQHGIIVTIA